MRGYSKTWNMFFYVRRPLLSPVLEYGLEVAMGDGGIRRLSQGRFILFREVDSDFHDSIYLITHCV